MTTKICVSLFPIVLALGLTLMPLHGQQTTGALTGEVSDASGAAVAGVRIEVRNVETGLVQRQDTTTLGTFAFNLLPSGTYSMRCSKASFQEKLIKEIRIEVNRTLRLPVTIEIGTVAQAMEVTASTAMVDVTSAKVSTNVEKRYVTELPSNTRNVLTFAELAPGVQIVRPASQVTNIEGSYARVNGLRQGANVFYLDGSDNSGSFRNGALQFPNPDTVQEVQVSTANTSAEFGKQPGGVINVITKSGTNQFHGSGFYFFRDEALNANTWARNLTGTSRAPDKIKQVGGTFGGPVRKEKTFFFGSYQHYRDETPGFQNNVQFPTRAAISGDFSQFSRPLYDPDTGAPIPGNRIPARLLDPVAARLAELIPTVSNLGDRFIWNYASPLRSNETLLKIDHYFTDRHQVQGSWLHTWGETTLPAPTAQANVPGFGPQVNSNSQDTASIRHTWVVSPVTMIESRFSLSRLLVDRNNAAAGRNLADFGANWPSVAEGARKYLPQLTVSDGFQTAQGNLGKFDQPNYRFGSTVSSVRSKHNLRFGGEAQRNAVSQFNDQDNSRFTFDGRSASRAAGANPAGIGVFGYALADFVMGRAASFNAIGIRDYSIHNWAYFFFAQDEFRITPRLTLTPGLRYEFYTPSREKRNKLSNFLFGHRSTLYPNAPLGLSFPGDPGIPDGLYEQDRNNLSPRLGLAYDPFGTGRTAIRAGFGVYYAYLAVQPVMTSAEQVPWNPSATGGETRNLLDPWGTSRTIIHPRPPTPFSTDVSRFTYPAVIAARGFDPNLSTPYTLQWNFTLQHEIRPGVAVQAGYVGNRGKKLIELVQVNSAAWAPNATLTNIQLRRPVAGYSDIGLNSTRSLSWHDSLQLVADIRTSQSFVSRFTYVYGKSFATVDEDLGFGTPNSANPLNLNNDKAINSPVHVMRYNFVYSLPALWTRGSAASRFLDGWQASGSLSISSGNPLNVILGEDWNLDGINVGDRPDRAGPIRYLTGSKDQRAASFFDRSAFTLPAIRNTFGSLSRNALFGPGQWNTTAALVKSFPVRERLAVQFRAEAFNLFNHNNLDAPNTNMRSADYTRILTRSGNRTMQLALRMSF
ncbi:MAG: TonB-dependent receptor [Bryobacterales bacterium]|nr:TonB-dependent receptor [Bryobacterales bacterium]